MIRKILLVIACLLLHMFSAGISFSFGVQYREMRLEFGISHSEAAWIASIFNGLLGFVGCFSGLLLTFWGLALVAGMPLAGFVTDSFRTERGAFIFASGTFFIATVLELVLGLRHICERKSSMLYTITPEANAVNIANEDLGIPNTVVGNEECSHI